MPSIVIENSKGKIIDLYKNYFTEVDGVTSAPATVTHAKSSGVAGGSLNNATVDVRNIVLTIYPKEPVEANRISLYEVIQTGAYIKMYYKNGARNVYIEGTVEDFDGSLFKQRQALTCSILCGEPYFKSASEIVADISKLTNNFYFPFAIDQKGIALSIFNEYLIGQIDNKGDVTTGLVVEIEASGTVVNPVIHNADTRDKMQINIAMQPADLITIDTNAGREQITLTRAGVVTNIINSIEDGSTWLQAKAGITFYTYTVDSGLDDLHVTLRANALYSGV